MWKEKDQENYFKKINGSNRWVRYRYTKIIANLTFVSWKDDTLVLFDLVSKLFYKLTSKYVYESDDFVLLDSSNPKPGAWFLVYYQAPGKVNIIYFLN